MELKTTQFVDHIIEHCKQQFPRSCPNCGREFGSFAEFVSATSTIGEPQAYDSVEDLLCDVGHPIGALSYVNCRCGTTLTLQCGDTSSDEYKALVESLTHDVEESGLTVGGVLEVLRQVIRARATREASAS